VHGILVWMPDGEPLVSMSSAALGADGGGDELAGLAEAQYRDRASAIAMSSGDLDLGFGGSSGASGEIDMTSWSVPEGGAGSALSAGGSNQPPSLTSFNKRSTTINSGARASLL